MELKARSLMHTAARSVACRQVPLPQLQSGQILAKGTFSGISTGTEALVFQGNIEPDIQLDASLPSLKDSTSAYPFPYGYAWVGIVKEVAPDVTSVTPGDRIFAFASHQDHHVLNAEDCIVLPEGLDCRQATLLPSMETALGVIHDAAPVAGESICIFGQGLIGCLVTWILSRFPLSSLKAVDPNKDRHPTSIEMGAHEALCPSDIAKSLNADTTIEVSGNPQAIAEAIQNTRPNGKVILASWYGTRSAELSLGTHFHRGRIQLISSQVSTIKPSLVGTWNKERRLEYAINLLTQLPTNRIDTQEIPFGESETRYPLVLESNSGLTHTYFNYGE